jgi:TPR repeat protein
LAQYNLGICYYDGDGVEQNYRIGANWIKNAANQNYPEALGQLSTVYITGQGVNRNLAKAYQYANRAAHMGNVLGIFNMGQFYEHGDNVKQSNIKAYAHYFITKKLDEQANNVNQMTLDYLARVKARMSAAQIRAAEREIPKLMHEYGLQ